MPVTFLYRLCKLLLAGVVVAVAGCSTTGNQFTTSDLRFLVRGETTLNEAIDLLQAQPVNIYRQLDGSAVARWAHTASLATDAVYFNQELWLAFDSNGRFERIVKSNNVPHANLYRDGRPVDAPAPTTGYAPYVPANGAAAPAFGSAPAPTSGHAQVVPPGNAPIAQAGGLNPYSPPAESAVSPNPISQNAVSYPVNR